ncbi:hypothetical protein GCM10011376_13500 [Nocardioides flavus (ex Wang et al. 2016)]|uniref:Helix-turn-helix domain-containing protein n=1 Tax=Nocardioides flavus (ex Wang et al. 2016) TaxID=2058780 RepID=A0ABQ3HLM6_9ACTN|nr:helix-turn-helix domain-containing protein [Nocardioides flavus (ex Wang et al. 2016)]GHE16740.1 hypothetical protein GCM10011376_13500 [Nocardioides flavus (ex Wang et al. 2016)]
MQDHLTPEELVDYLRGTLTLGTLRNYRSARRGPRYITIGRTVLYPRTAVDAWLEELKAAAALDWDEPPWLKTR